MTYWRDGTLYDKPLFGIEASALFTVQISHNHILRSTLAVLVSSNNALQHLGITASPVSHVNRMI